MWHAEEILTSSISLKQEEKESKIKGFNPFRANHIKCTRGSIIYVRDGYVPRIIETEENTVEHEFIHLIMDAILKYNRSIRLNPEVAEATQKVITDKVQKRV